MEERCIAYLANGKQEFVAGYQEEREGRWEKRIMYYDVIGDCTSLSDNDVRKALNYAMSTWDIEINVEFKPTWIEGRKPDIRVDFRDSTNDDLFAKHKTVLAYAYYPNQGEISGLIVFNNDYIWSLNGNGITVKEALEKGFPVLGNPLPETKLKTFNIIHTLIHELGHMLGLTHDEHTDSTDVMDSHYNGKLELSDYDLYRIRLKYAPRVYGRWSWYSRLKNALRRAKLRF